MIQTSKKDYPIRVKELQERIDLTPVLLGSFPLYATDNNAVHVIVEQLSHCSEEQRGELFAAVRGMVEKSLAQPELALAQDVKAVEAPAQEESEESEEEEESEKEMEEEEEKEGEEEENEEEEEENEEENGEENGEENEEEKEMKQEDQEMEEEKGMEEEKEMKQEEVVVAYKDIWGITAWTVFLKRVISHCEENEALKACLMKEIVTPLKDKWEYSDTIMRRFMKLIETYPDSLFLVAVETECDE